MKRVALLTVAALFALASSAGAADHRMEIREVLLSNGGNTAAQFVELQDHADEPFPSETYRLVLYNASGARVGHQEFASGFLAGRDNAQPLLLTSSAWNSAADPDGDLALTLTLPAAGQLCFTRAGATESKIHCVAWGCVTTYVTGAEGGVDKSPAPVDSKSIQLGDTPSGHVWTVATPTPKAANSAGATAENCPGGGGGGSGGGGGDPSGGGGGGGTTTPPDTTKPVPKLIVPSTPRIKALVDGKFKVGITANEPCTVIVEMKVSSKLAKKLKTKRVIADSSAGALPASVKLKAMTRKLGRQLKKLKSLKVTITVTVFDAANNSAKKSKTITLK